MQQTTITPLEALAQLTAVASQIDTAECKDEGIYNRLQGAVQVAQAALAMPESPKAKAVAWIKPSDLEKFLKHHNGFAPFLSTWDCSGTIPLYAGAAPEAALAMAPKQEAPAGWKLVPEDPTGDMFRAAAKIDNEMFAGGSSHGAEDGQIWAAMYDAAPEAPVAAPAAANGALADADIHRIAQENGIYDDNIRPSGEMLESFARAILAAAGPGAALVKTPYAWVNAGTERQQIEYATLSVGPDNPWRDSANAFPVYTSPDPVRKGLELAAEQLAEYCENMGYHNSYVDEVRAALSGAKGN